MPWLKLGGVIVLSGWVVWHFPILWELGLVAIIGSLFWIFGRPQGGAERSITQSDDEKKPKEAILARREDHV